MGDKIALALAERTVHGKKVKSLRHEGFVPAVVYGPGIDPISVQVESGIMLKTYKQAGTHAPVHLTIGGKKKIAMIKDVDFDPVRGEIRHVSFHAVKASDPVVAEVPVRLVGEGESVAEKNGLVVLQALEKIEVKALPMDLPDAIEVSILGLAEAGDKVTLADATLSAGVEYVEHESGHGDEDEEKPSITDLMVASAWEPAALAAANESAAGDAEDESEVESENGSEEAPAEEAKEEKAE
ncbi:MAG TPA: 50S ribosomal protein L25 [Candidatus Saccharimonadales bacterium]